MAREAIPWEQPTPGAPHQSIVVRAGDLLFTSGFDISRAHAQANSLNGQTEQMMDAVGQALERLGSDASRMVKLKLTIDDWDCLPGISESLGASLTPHFPARGCVGGGLVGTDVIASVEVIASGGERPQPVGDMVLGWDAPRWGSMIGDLYLSNTVISRDAAGHSLALQAEDIFNQLANGLAHAGQDFSDIAKVNGTPVAWHGLAAYNDVYKRYLPEPFAGRATIQGALPRSSALIALEIMAMAGEPRLCLQSGDAGVGVASRGSQQCIVRITPDLHPLKGPHSHAMRVASTIFAAGACPYDSRDALIRPGDIGAQTRQTLKNLKCILRELGCELDDIVKTNVTLSNRRLFAEFDATYARFFRAPYPARQTVIAGLAQPGMLVEIEAIAVIGAARTSVALVGDML